MHRDSSDTHTLRTVQRHVRLALHVPPGQDQKLDHKLDPHVENATRSCFFVPPLFAGQSNEPKACTGLWQPRAAITKAGFVSKIPVEQFNASHWSTLISGSKLYWLYPPGRAAAAMMINRAGDTHAMNISASQFFRRLREMPTEHRPLQCTIKANESIYVPSGWQHTSFSLQDSVCVAGGFLDGANIAQVMQQLKQEIAANSSSSAEASDCIGAFERCSDSTTCTSPGVALDARRYDAMSAWVR